MISDQNETFHSNEKSKVEELYHICLNDQIWIALLAMHNLFLERLKCYKLLILIINLIKIVMCQNYLK